MSIPPGAPSSSWVRELVRARPASVPWDLAVITAVAIALPVGIALALMPTHPGVLGLGVLISIGALVASVADRGGAAVDRVRRIGITAGFAAVGLAIGSLVLGHDIATFVVVVVAALLSGVAGVVSGNVSQAALQFLVYVVVGSGIDFGLRPLWLAPVVFLVGASWRFVLTGLAIAIAGRSRVRAPERQVVASVYRQVAAQLDAAGTDAADAARRGVTAALNDAYDLMVATRTTLAGRDPRWRTIVTLLNAATPVVEAATAVASEAKRVPADVTNGLRSIARSIEDPKAPPPVLPAPDRSTPSRAALTSSLRQVGALLSGDDPVTMTVPIQRPDAVPLPGITFGERMRRAADHLTSGGETWFAVLRLVVCVAVAEGLSVLLPLERPYWITLTVAVVMKPDFGSVFARAVQRGLGTVLGVLIGGVVVAFLPVGWPQVLALAVLAAIMPIATRRNYGLFSVFITPVIVILLELAHGDDPGLIVSRVTDTLIGCAIVVFVGYLPWPATWRSGRHLGERVAEVAGDVSAYLMVALASDPDSRRAEGGVSGVGNGGDSRSAGAGAAARRASARRATYRRLSDLRTLVQQNLAEPPPVSTAAASWWPEIVALERVTDAITSTAIRAAQSRVRVDDDDVRALGSALDDLADAIRERRTPDALELPESDLLDSVAAEVTAARAVLAS